MRIADRVTAILLLAFSVAFAAGALTHYKWWGDDGPGPAFLPFWLGLLMAVLASLMLARTFREPGAPADWPRGRGLADLVVVQAATLAYGALLTVTGMVIGTALYLTGLARYLGRHRWWVCVAVGAGTAAFNWLVFAKWLRLPFPVGPLGF